jgi:soluble lytic murein transglycosylase-like protein
MGAVKGALLAAAWLWAAPAAADPIDLWSAHVAEASSRFGIPKEWIRRVMRAESGGRTSLNGRPIVSHAGAMGLMQLMPGTWRELRGPLGLGHDPHAPRDNILAGAAYLRAMYDRFGYPGLFAAYNAGPARYAEHLRSGRRLPSETRAYVAQVAGEGAAPQFLPAAAPSPLFATLTFGAAPGAARARAAPASSTSDAPRARPASGMIPAVPARAASALFVPLSGAARP